MRPVTERLWRTVRGVELAEAIADESIDELVEQCSAIYMWKRSLRPTSITTTDAHGMIDWLCKLVDSPHGVVTDKRVGPFLWLSRLELRSNSMPEQQLETLERWVADRRHRRWLTQYVTKLETQTPALYVGETGDLSQRIRHHLGGHTNFSNRNRWTVFLGRARSTLFQLE